MEGTRNKTYLVMKLLSVILLLLASISAHTIASATLTIKLTDVKSTKGHLMLLLCNKEKAWMKEEGSIIRFIVRADSLTAEGLTFHLQPGEYAISIIHDLDGNQKLDENILGVPVEPFGFSNNPLITTGPPDYEDCTFENSEGENAITIKMKEF